MDTKSFSCKIRNNLSEISFIESLIYKYNFKCKANCIKANFKKTPDRCIKACEINTEKFFTKYSDKIKFLSSENKVCLINCTDKLNFPSEELTCYDRCEESYNYKLTDLKENLYKEFDKIMK